MDSRSKASTANLGIYIRDALCQNASNPNTQMKLNTVLPWVLVVGLGAGAAVLFAKGSAKDAELTKLREENTEIQQLRTELTDVKDQARAQQSEIETLRK